jgi:predicted RNase H-like nuclease (RuvC/YqgF family)
MSDIDRQEFEDLKKQVRTLERQVEEQQKQIATLKRRTTTDAGVHLPERRRTAGVALLKPPTGDRFQQDC